MKSPVRHPWAQFVGVLLLSTGASLLLFLIDSWRNHNFEFAFLIWNLFLAWLPLIFAGWLVRVLRRKLWSSWEALLASFLWLLFLPNSFYMVTDFIHLADVQRYDILYDAVMFTSFVFVAIVLGVTSLYLVHEQFRKRYTAFGSDVWLALIFFLSSFAIYLGRDLRWNSWDILTNPGGLLFDVSDRLLHPSQYPQMLLTVLIFFILLTSIYSLAWKSIELIQSAHHN